MQTQQTSYTNQPVENRPDLPPPIAQRQPIPEYNEQYVEMLAQRLMPRLMPAILYQVQRAGPIQARNKAFGMSLALAIVSLALMIPLTAIMLGAVQTLGGGFATILVGISVIGLVMVLINAMFDYLLFNAKS
ncbi:MAG TPA: hypothetical protein VFN23_12260 [Ktedonobacteraceae bacterium]|nr:hypothetical protein [Ktedonobacteraceae bacterium]